MIGGDLYTPRVQTDDRGQPVIGKDGKPKSSYHVGIAIPKGSEQHWSQTPWGQIIYQEAFAAYDQMANSPLFSWKITDGDSAIPNKKGNAPKDQTGYAGHWVLWFNSSFVIKIVNADGTRDITDQGALIPGYYCQVYMDVKPNGSKSKPAQTPGVYLNPLVVALSGYGEPIVNISVDAKSVGFGGALPPGASATPIAAMSFPGQPAPAPGGFSGQPAPAPGGFPGQPAPAPNYAILQPAPMKTLTPAANGWTYEQLIQAGYTDETLVQHGMMIIS